jgi:hypothetical protein
MHRVENGKMIAEATVPGVRLTKFKVEYLSQEIIIISYKLLGTLWGYTLHLPLEKIEHPLGSIKK